jgi:hypothetical protein
MIAAQSDETGNPTVIVESSTTEGDARWWAVRMLKRDDPDHSLKIASLLSRVTESDYVLSNDETDAVQIIANSNLDGYSPLVNRAAVAGCYERQKEAIGAFTRSYFDLPCAERTRQWKAMTDDCSAFPDLTARLLRLKPGLNVDWPQVPSQTRSRYILQTCRNVFLASPPDAAHFRRTLCNQWRADVAGYEDAVDELLDAHRELFQAVAPWVDQFGDQRFWDSKPVRNFKVADRMTQDPVPADPKPFQQPSGQMTDIDTRSRQEYQAPETPEGRLGTLTIVLTVLVVIGAVLILLSEGIDTTNKPPEKPVRPRSYRLR